MTSPTPPSLSPGVGCEHTPGPWFVFSARSIRSRNPQHKGVEVAHTTGGWNDKRRLANARLIAAAPDMFEALEGFVEARDRYLESDCDSHAEHMAANRLDEAHEAARAALARAKGDRA
jgi:hypothetical protein